MYMYQQIETENLIFLEYIYNWNKKQSLKGLLGRLVKEGATFWRMYTMNISDDVSMPSEQLIFSVYVLTAA